MTLFFSGSSKITTNPGDKWYLNPEQLKIFDHYIFQKDADGNDVDIVIGDAPGFDSIMQDYLFKKGVKYVIVCHGEPDGPRHKADPEWEEAPCPSRELKDKFMRAVCDVCIGVTIPGGSRVTRKNLEACKHKLALNWELSHSGHFTEGYLRLVDVE